MMENWEEECLCDQEGHSMDEGAFSEEQDADGNSRLQMLMLWMSIGKED